MPSAVVVALFATEPRRQRASRPPRPRPGTSSSAPSVATEAAALDEEDLSPWWWTHRPAPSAAIGEPFEHDSRSASGAGGRPAGGAALESAPDASPLPTPTSPAAAEPGRRTSPDVAGNPSAAAVQFSIVADLTPVPALPVTGALALALLLLGGGDGNRGCVPSVATAAAAALVEDDLPPRPGASPRRST